MKKAILPLLLGVTIISCKKNDEPIVNTPSELYPLKVGNKWTFNYFEFNENGSVKLAINQQDTVTGTITSSGKTFYLVTGQYNTRNADENTIEIDNGDTVRPAYKKVTIDDELIHSEVNSDSSKSELRGFTTLYKVNEYKCYKNEEICRKDGQTESKTVYYLQPGVGYVWIEYYKRKSNGNGLYLMATRELKSYSLL